MEFNFGGFSSSYSSVESFSNTKEKTTPLVAGLITVPRYRETRFPKIDALARKDKIKLHPVYPNDDPKDTRLQKIHKSHLNVLKWCKEKHPGKDCLVLEDDASWNTDLGLRKPIQEITKDYSDWDLAILGHRKIPNRNIFDKSDYSARTKETKGGCHAYVVKGSSIDKMIDVYEKRDAKNPCVERMNAEEWGVNIVVPSINGAHVNLVGQDQKGKEEAYAVDKNLVDYIAAIE